MLYLNLNLLFSTIKDNNIVIRFVRSKIPELSNNVHRKCVFKRETYSFREIYD